jgi:hypothetical protein
MENWLVFILVGLVCGIFGASLGVGGGAIFVPVLAIAFGFTQKSAQGMSLAVIVPLAAVAAMRYYQNPQIEINLGVVLFLAVGAVVGAVIGAKIAAVLPGNILRKFFAIFLAVVAVKMFLAPAKKPAPQENITPESQQTQEAESAQ